MLYFSEIYCKYLNIPSIDRLYVRHFAAFSTRTKIYIF